MTKIATFPTAGGTAPSRASAAPLVTFRGVDKVFANKVMALSGLDLEIRTGEFLALLGPSGCGKSTVLRLLTGLAAPTRGEIVWSCERPEFGFVFQEPTLMPWSDVFSNVWLPLRLAGVSKEKAQAAHRGGAGAGRAVRLRLVLSPAIVGRDEDARFDRPRAGDAPGGSPDGRTLRRAR